MTAWVGQTSGFDGDEAVACCWSPDLSLFLAGGSGSESLATSPDGVNWTDRPSAIGGGVDAVVWADTLGLFVAGGADGGSDIQIITSPDGAVWTPQVTPWDDFATHTIRGLAWSPDLGLLIAVGKSFTAGETVMTSPDGVNWTAQSTPFDSPSSGAEGNGVCWATGLGLFIVAGLGDSGDTVMTSPDGAAWTSQTTPWDSSGQANGCCWSDVHDLAIVVGYQDGSSAIVMTSTNGTVWTSQTTPMDGLAGGHGTGLCGGTLVVVGKPREFGGTLLLTTIESTDGSTWIADTSPLDRPDGRQADGVCYSPELLLAVEVGRHGTDSVAIATATFAAPVATTAGINIAFENDALDENPTWVRLDDPDGYRLITGWSTRRGKDDNLDKSATGTATLKGVDLDGTLDPTNTGSPFYGMLGSQKPAIILIQHAFTLEWHSIFRGFVDRYNHDLDMWTDARGIDTFEIELYDGFGYLSRVELMPGVHGEPVSIADFPNIYYPGTPSNLADEPDVFVHVDDRLVKLLDDAGWPNTGEKRNGLRDIYSGNCSVQGSVVDRGDGLMAALGDAVDAELPGKANHYMSKDGVYSFRGRFAFIFPENPGYGINTWDAGTATIARADSGVAAISGLRFSDQELINSCIALPQGVDDADVPGNLVEDAGSITAFGRSGATFPDLIVSAGHTDDTPTTAVEECFKFADFYVGNQADQRTIVTGLSFIGVTDDTLGPAIWDLMCGVEIGDVVNLTTTHPGGGGFDEELRVDNIAYTSEVGQPLRLELEVSPQPTYNPFGSIDVGNS